MKLLWLIKWYSSESFWESVFLNNWNPDRLEIVGSIERLNEKHIRLSGKSSRVSSNSALVDFAWFIPNKHIVNLDANMKEQILLSIGIQELNVRTSVTINLHKAQIATTVSFMNRKFYFLSLLSVPFYDETFSRSIKQRSSVKKSIHFFHLHHLTCMPRGLRSNDLYKETPML